MKNRGVVGRINSKQGRVSAFSTVGHGTGLPGAYTSNSLLLSSSLSLSLCYSSRRDTSRATNLTGRIERWNVAVACSLRDDVRGENFSEIAIT